MFIYVYIPGRQALPALQSAKDESQGHLQTEGNSSVVKQSSSCLVADSLATLSHHPVNKKHIIYLDIS